MAGYLDEVVIASTKYVNEEIKHIRKDSFVQFARGNILIKIGNSKYVGEVIVGYTKSGALCLYDVINLIPTNYKTRGSNVYRSESNDYRQQTRATSIDIKPQNENDVNENDSTEFSRDELYSSEGDKFSLNDAPFLEGHSTT